MTRALLIVIGILAALLTAAGIMHWYSNLNWHPEFFQDSESNSSIEEKIIRQILSDGISSYQQEKECCEEIENAIGIQLSLVKSYALRSIVSGKNAHGFFISRVKEGSPAERAGLQKGDVVNDWNKEPIKSAQQLAGLIRAAKKGDKIIIKYHRPKKDSSRNPWNKLETTLIINN
ncbi:MAG: PDZ domain-containing protein [Planctomycetes bacterium]|nr:PDZ domain-containing protein [Planctomycetota bacterium]